MTTPIRYFLLSVASFGLGFLTYVVAAPTFPICELLRVQLGAGFQPLPLPPGTEQEFLGDFPFILGYLLSLWWAARLAPALFRGARAAVVCRRLRIVAVFAAAADFFENLLVLASLSGSLPEPDVRALLSLATQSATVKFLCFIPAAILGVALVVAAVVRTLWSWGKAGITARGTG